MRRITACSLLAAALLVILAIPVIAGPGGQQNPTAQRPRATALVSVEGVITAINQGRASFIMRVLTPGHRRQVGSDTMTVMVQTGTDVHLAEKGGRVDFDRPARIQDFRVGDRVHVQALRMDNGMYLATRVVVQNRQVQEPARGGVETQQGQVVQFQGIVIDKGDRSLRVRQTNGTVRTVLVTSTTDITGRVATFRAIRINDLVVVRGTVNADGTVVARRIDVLRSAAGESTITGTIVLKNAVGGRFVLLNSGQAVSVSETTQIVSGGRLRSFEDLQIGMTITVIGSPMTVAGVLVGINARLITF